MESNLFENNDFYHHIGSRSNASINSTKFLILISDLRAITENNQEPEKIKPSSISRIKDFCKSKGIPFEKYMKLNHRGKVSIVIDAFIGFKPAIDIKLQYGCALDLAFAEANKSRSFNKNERITWITAALRIYKEYSPDKLEASATGEDGSIFNKHYHMKQILNFSARESMAKGKLIEAVISRNETDGNRIDIFEMAAMSAGTWISSQMALKYYEKHSRYLEHPEINIAGAKEYFFCICTQLKFNPFQASRIILEGIHGMLFINGEETVAFINDLRKLQGLGSEPETPDAPGESREESGP